MTDERRRHWDHVYATKPVTAVSWYEAAPTTSTALLARLAPAADAALLDVGAGASLLADALLAGGRTDVTVLDVSPVAVGLVAARVGERVHTVVADVTSWLPPRQWDLWHDRAVFHFLTDEADRRRYASVAAAALKPGRVAVISTFAPQGPERCSGLPVMRHDDASVRAALGEAFALEETHAHAHTTPAGTTQHFHVFVLRRR